VIPEPQSVVRCPRCGGADIRLSFRRPLLDGIMTMFRMTPLRCRACRHRFFKRLLPEEEVRLAGGNESDRLS
jgi:DNA-directed RNA polymerase subunit RPC12/RpoP